MPKCSFCGYSFEKGTGKMFVYTSGKISYFCTRRCEKNVLRYKRKPLTVRWTAEYRRENKKDNKSEEKAQEPLEVKTSEAKREKK